MKYPVKFTKEQLNIVIGMCDLALKDGGMKNFKAVNSIIDTINEPFLKATQGDNQDKK